MYGLPISSERKKQLPKKAIYAKFGEEEVLVTTFAKDECRTLAMENGTSFREEALKEVYKKLRPGEPAIVESAEILILQGFPLFHYLQILFVKSCKNIFR